MLAGLTIRRGGRVQFCLPRATLRRQLDLRPQESKAGKAVRKRKGKRPQRSADFSEHPAPQHLRLPRGLHRRGLPKSLVSPVHSHLCSIVMEYADHGDLFQKIQRHQKEQTYIREDEIWKFFIQVVQGLKALHDAQVLHRDLKSANVFLNRDGSAKLGDMNVSKIAKKGLLYT